MGLFTSKAYDKLRSLIFPFGLIMNEIPDRGNMLDVGSGHGTFPLYVAKRKRDLSVLGVEMDRRRVLIAREKAKGLKNVKFVCSDFRVFEVRGKFNVVACLDVLHHIPKVSHTEVIRKIYKLLKPNGVFILVEIDTRPLPKYLWNYVHDFVFTRSLNMNYVGRGEIASLVKSCGFSISSVKDASTFLYGRYMLVCRK
ncbi:MAG: class I SAM-dependent methyltransferase [Candidatus Aenigmarchaeota archaeon]|nr:class I SAM-dependent methyltransferase [Candidatus Aenigmarchaeota archaeon]